MDDRIILELYDTNLQHIEKVIGAIGSRSLRSMLHVHRCILQVVVDRGILFYG